MNQLKYLLFVVVTILITSCGASFGEKYTVDNLEIYYTDEIAMHYVEDLANYFKTNKLIQPKKHSVQLTSDSNSFILKMILNEAYEKLPSQQQHNLELLTAELKASVFNGGNFRIEVCDINFNPIRTN